MLLLAHEPPPVPSVSIVVNPAHTFNVPDMDAGKELTVTAVVVTHPVVNAYVTVVVPAVMPFTIPVPDPIEATAVLLLLHSPNGVASVRFVVEDTHTLVVPDIPDGNGLTVYKAVAIHPVGKV